MVLYLGVRYVVYSEVAVISMTMNINIQDNSYTTTTFAFELDSLCHHD